MSYEIYYIYGGIKMKILKYIILILIILAINTLILINSFKITNIEKTATGQLTTAEIAGITVNYYYEY